MLIIDSQIHLWQGDAAPAHHRNAPYLADEALRDMDAAGVDRAIVCPAIWDDQANDYAMQAALEHPDRFATMGWFPLTMEADAAFVAEFLDRPGTAGLRFVFATPEVCQAFASGQLDWIWEVTSRLRRPVSFGAPKVLLPAIGAVAERFPDGRFLIDHLGVGAFEKLPDAMNHIDTLIALAAMPNLAVKASATPSMSNLAYPFSDTSPFLERVFQAYGPERFFWGTDYTRMHVSLGKCVSHFTEHLPWLREDDLKLVMGQALSAWIDWPASVSTQASR